MAKKLQIKEYRAGMIVSGYTDNRDLNSTVQNICTQNKAIKCLGDMVDSRNRHLAYFISYKGQLYETREWHAVTLNKGMSVSIIFESFDGQITDLDPISNYSYKLDYYKPNVTDRGGEVWYYKKEELMLAKQKQAELGEKYAFLKEIKQ